MSKLKKYHYYLQSSCLLLALLLLSVGVINTAFILYIMLFQSVVGCIQLACALMGLAFKTWRSRLGTVHLFGTGLYFLLCMSGYILNDLFDVSLPSWLIIGFVFILPWVLAINYWLHSRYLHRQQGVITSP